MKIRARIAKGEAVRFISHLDFAGAVEKAVRRAGLPLALSRGFTPRLKISFASALALGATSEAEYADFELETRISVSEFVRCLNQQLPEGIEILAAAQVAANAPSLMAKVCAASYRVTAKLPPAAEGRSECLWNRFLQQNEIVITKITKRRTRQVDIRPLVLRTRFYPRPGDSRWDLLVATGAAGNLRPEELLQAFFAYSGLEGEVTHIHRTGLFIERYGQLMSPLARLRLAEELGEEQ